MSTNRASFSTSYPRVIHSKRLGFAGFSQPVGYRRLAAYSASLDRSPFRSST